MDDDGQRTVGWWRIGALKQNLLSKSAEGARRKGPGPQANLPDRHFAHFTPMWVENCAPALSEGAVIYTILG